MLELIDFPLKQTQTASGVLKIIHSRVNAATSQPKGCWFESWPDPISVSSHVLRGFLPPSTGMRVRLMTRSEVFVTLCYPVTAGIARLQPSFAYTEETGYVRFFYTR